MKGVVFNLLEAFVCEGWGDEVYEALLERTELETQEPFVGPGTYPDSDLVALASNAAIMLDLPLGAVLRAFGEYCFPQLAAKVPMLVDSHSDLISFLQSIDSVLHVEVRKLMPQAVTPTFLVDRTGPDTARLAYHSERRLCGFMEGLLVGAGRHFGSDVEFTKHSCMHQGAASCEYDLVVHVQPALPTSIAGTAAQG